MINKDTLKQKIIQEIKDLHIKYINPSKLAEEMMKEFNRNPKLLECTEESIINFCKTTALAGTDRIGSGGMWAVPHYNKEAKRLELTAIPDWRLLVEKAKLAKAIVHASADVIYPEDEIEYEKGLEPKFKHIPKLEHKGSPIAYYCIYILPNGIKDFVIMTKKEIEKIRESSKSKDFGPWKDYYDEMAKKTVIKRALKLFEGASPELTMLIELDNRNMGFTDTEEPAPIKEPQPKKKKPKKEPKTEEGIILS